MYINHLESLEERISGLLRESRDPDFTNYLVQMQKRVADQKQQTVLLTEELNRREQIYRSSIQMQGRQVQSAPVQQPASQVIYQAVPQTMQPMSQPIRSLPQTAPSPAVTPRIQQQSLQPKSSAEFAIGATVLSIVGSVFILAALVMLGMYFMTGLTKGGWRSVSH